MTEQQKIEKELAMFKNLLATETNLLKQGEYSAKIKKLNEALDKVRPIIKNPALKAGSKPADLKSSDIGAHESKKINKDWQDLTKGKKK